MLIAVVSVLILIARVSEGADSNTVTYDRYTAKPATSAQLTKYKKANTTSTCTVAIKACDATERRRVDGSCNNLKHPAKGTFFEPVSRMLPALYANVSESRRSVDGSQLGLPRVISTTLLSQGKSVNTRFTQAMTTYQIWTFGDVASIHDLRNTLQTDCCSAKGRKNRHCRPTYVPDDDPVFRYSGVNCLNMTKPLFFSDFGCTADIKPSPIQRGTATFDLSPIYNALGAGDTSRRSNEGGQMTVDVDPDGIIWPPNGNGYCPANQPGETRCFGEYTNVLIQTMLISIWFLRQHNRFASELAALNPCWDDETLYQTARDMNIAYANQMYYYEYLPEVIGKNTLVKNGIISNNSSFRDIYNETVVPQVSLEYTYAMRWYHTCQSGNLKMYAADGTYLKDYPVTNTTFRPGFLDIPGPNGDKNIILLSQHMYRQPCAKIGQMVDPDIANRGQAYIQKYFDVPSNDLNRGRYLGFARYIDYVKKCTGKAISSFDDLKPIMAEERIELLKQVYNHVEDIELLAGIWSEDLIEGGYIPATMACIFMDFVKKAIQFDRHWYERADRPHPFTKEQLAEIRKSTMAQFICNNADQVSEVQPKAFRLPGTENKITPCSDIPSIDFSPWYDSSCENYSYLASLSVSKPGKDKNLTSSFEDMSNFLADDSSNASMGTEPVASGGGEATSGTPSEATSGDTSDIASDADSDADSGGSPDANPGGSPNANSIKSSNSASGDTSDTASDADPGDNLGDSSDANSIASSKATSSASSDAASGAASDANSGGSSDANNIAPSDTAAGDSSDTASVDSEVNYDEYWNLNIDQLPLMS